MDTADQELSVAELRSSRELLLQAQKLGRTGYVISDVATDRVYWSESLFEMRKIPRREYFTRAEAMSFIFPEDRVKFETKRDAAIAARKSSFTFEIRTVCGDGTHLWERGIAQPRYDAQGNYAALLTVVQDITESRTTAVTLRDQEATYRTLFDGMGDATILTRDNSFVDCNAATLEMFRCTSEDIIGKTPDFISPLYQPDGRLSVEKAAEKIAGALRGERQMFEWRHKRFGGEEFDAEVTLNLVDIPGEKYFFGVIRDVSERKRAEQALKFAHEKFAKAFDTSADAMIVATVGDEAGEGIILDVNLAVRSIFGLNREEMLGHSIGELNVVSNAENLLEVRRHLLDDGALQSFPLTLLRKDGSSTETELNGSTFRIGDRLHCLMIIRDVTERLEAERRIRDLNESLNASLKQLRDITDNLPVLISYQDAEGRFQFVNKTAEQWLGASAEQLLGKTVQESMPQAYLDGTRTVREKRARGITRVEATTWFPDEITRTVEANFIHDIDQDGVVRGTYTVTADITERKATEEQLYQSQKLQAIGKLTGGVAHDFNNLLAIILGNLELANEKLKGGDEKVRKLLAPALRAAERGATLTRSLLAFARQQPLEPAVLDVMGMVRDMTNLLRRTVPANIEIEFVSSAGLWRCEADPGQLQNALLNLVVNSRDAMPDGGKLTIEIGNVRLDDDYALIHAEVNPGQYVMLAVSDTGTGMPPEVIARVFEPFFTTKGLGHGTGLGLSMVYGFAKQSGGHVAIYSEPGQGTTVRIYLPRWAGSADAQPAQKQAAIAASNNEKILVVEDDEDVRFITVTMLRALGYEVLEASDGNTALAVLRGTDGIELLVTDVVLAGPMNGKKIAAEAQAVRPGIKVIYMSGYTENAIVHHGRLDQGVHFIQKPFRKMDLAAKVRNVLDQDDATV